MYNVSKVGLVKYKYLARIKVGPITLCRMFLRHDSSY